MYFILYCTNILCLVSQGRKIRQDLIYLKEAGLSSLCLFGKRVGDDAGGKRLDQRLKWSGLGQWDSFGELFTGSQLEMTLKMVETFSSPVHLGSLHQVAVISQSVSCAKI